MRAWSKAVFRNDHRLSVAVAALTTEPGELYSQAIADELAITQAEARKHLAAFESVGLLEVDPRIGDREGAGRPPRSYRRTDDPFWRCLEELGDRFRRHAPPRTGQQR